MGIDLYIKKQGFATPRLLVLLGTTLFFILMVAYFFYGLQPSLASEEEIKFKILKGEGFRNIGARLSQERLIKSISVFKLYALISGNAQKFQPGIYDLGTTMSVPEIIDTLTTGGKDELSITIPEGSSLKDIESILASNGIIEPGTLENFSIKSVANDYPFLRSANSLEGFLFPDTYRFKLNSDTSLVVARFLDNFRVKAWEMLVDRKDWYNSLILASYLEREVIDFEDRQIVAGILIKRSKIGIPLQVDATVSYAKCDGRLKGCEGIIVSKKDLTLSSPYNTYQKLGFTPTPIANPGQVAIKAALTPRVSPYFYYLSAKNTKETVFSKTLEEHNLNRFKYL